MPNENQANLDHGITRGNVCVDEKGKLFVALNIYRVPTGNMPPKTWYGLGFNGEQIYATNCVWISDTINEYLKATYGTDYSAEVASA